MANFTVKDILVKLSRKMGYQMTRIGQFDQLRLGYDYEDRAAPSVSLVRPYTMLNRERLTVLYQQVKFCEDQGLPGGFVECGVWKGGGVALMALANLRESTIRRNIHLFDSFTDICQPDEAVDGERAVAEAKRWADSNADGELIPMDGFYESMGGHGTLDGNRQLLEHIVGYDSAFLHYHVGWFQETLPRDGPYIGEISILRLDGDWYASTKVCLESLYDQVVPGGFIVVDDYGCYDGCRKAVDEFRKSRGIAAFLHHVDSDCRYWIKP